MIEYEPSSGLFIYDSAIDQYIAGDFSDRALWDALLAGGAATKGDAEKIKELVAGAAAEDDCASLQLMVALSTPSHKLHNFLVSAKKRISSADFPERVVITLIDIVKRHDAKRPRQKNTGFSVWSRRYFLCVCRA